jgi:hypothetical protein
MTDDEYMKTPSSLDRGRDRRWIWQNQTVGVRAGRSPQSAVRVGACAA